MSSYLFSLLVYALPANILAAIIMPSGRNKTQRLIGICPVREIHPADRHLHAWPDREGLDINHAVATLGY